ncbi:MAG: hypothetical protein CENE_03489 [Candidatus Celerinatantimonas neptuna]|nr:MAG: hypothetical protein CENE_03489 [Candidatus Celerinatantimonas neptuna]
MLWKNQPERDELFFYVEHSRDERKRATKRRHRLTQSRRRMRH